MRLKLSAFLLIALNCFFAEKAESQSLNWSLVFNGIADNREYFNPYTEPGTIAGVRISPALNYNFQDKHNLWAGINYMYEFGAALEALSPQLNLHYSYSDSLFDFKIGAFPRRGNVDYPQALIIDTMYYYRPHIEGAFVKVKFNFGNQYVWFDWINRQSVRVSERFHAGTAGKYNYQNFFFENYIYMYHKGGSKDQSYARPVRDNGASALYLGYEKESFLKWKAKLGYISSYNRMRMSPYRFFYGGAAQASFRKSIFGLDLLFYAGTKQLLKYGDWFYRAGRYARADAYLMPFENETVQLKVNFAFHQVDDILDMSQHLLLIVNIKAKAGSLKPVD